MDYSCTPYLPHSYQCDIHLTEKSSPFQAKRKWSTCRPRWQNSKINSAAGCWMISINEPTNWAKTKIWKHDQNNNIQSSTVLFPIWCCTKKKKMIAISILKDTAMKHHFLQITSHVWCSDRYSGVLIQNICAGKQIFPRKPYIKLCCRDFTSRIIALLIVIT